MEHPSIFTPPAEILSLIKAHKIQFINAEWDEEGIYVYQAFNSGIADYAIKNQKFGGPLWGPSRMTWIKPSFAWVLYRSGYGRKINQNRILKIKLSHPIFAKILAECSLANTIKNSDSAENSTKNSTKSSTKSSTKNLKQDSTKNSTDNSTQNSINLPKTDIGSSGRVQWDPERDLYSSEPKKNEPRKMLKTRAIQIGLKGGMNKLYVENVISIEDVTELSVFVGEAHSGENEQAVMARMKAIEEQLPVERIYWPALSSESDLMKLGMIDGEEADQLTRLGKGIQVKVKEKANVKHDSVENVQATGKLGKSACIELDFDLEL